MLYDSDIKEIYGLNQRGPARDAVGIEIEMELTERMPSEPLFNEVAPGWQIKSDGSLRNHGYEFISDPTPMKNLSERLGGWDKVLSSGLLKTRIDDCPRASVHVHVNVRDYTYNQLMNIIVAYTLLEGALVAYCGKYRFGNLFALRIPEAQANFRQLMSSVKNYTPFKLNGDHRYGAFNLCSLSRFGTIEFRSLGSVYDPAEIDLWVSGLRHMVDHAARDYQKPPDVYARYVAADRRTFMSEFLGPLAPAILKKNLDLDSLFEDGEEYTIRLLASHPDNWTYEQDFRNNKELLEILKKDYGYSRKQIIWMSAKDARGVLKETKERQISINTQGDFTDWVPAPDPQQPTAVPTSSTHTMLWRGDLPREAFRGESEHGIYTSWILNGSSEANARREAWDSGYLTTNWLLQWASPIPRRRQAPLFNTRSVNFNTTSSSNMWLTNAIDEMVASTQPAQPSEDPEDEF